ncbi:MAG: DUF4125 family protein [Collinsella sp.]|nr:DUF4125 family protein [Collinsella sp.]
MSRKEVIDTIIRHEWDDFSHVRDIDGVSDCQRRPDVFTRMRRALLETWSDELLESYLEDVLNAKGSGRSLMSEKYAWMMQTVDSEHFADIVDMLPMLPYEACERIERIVKVFLVWQAWANALHPRLTADGRPLLTEDDAPGITSFETYTRGELKSYSPRTVEIYERYVIDCWRHGRNLALENLDNIARSYGYADADDAEARSN